MDAILKEAEGYAARYDVSEPEAEQEENERFSVTETSDAFEEPFAVWDNEKEDYHVSEDGTVPTFETVEEAVEYSNKENGREENVGKENSDKENNHEVNSGKENSDKENNHEVNADKDNSDKENNREVNASKDNSSKESNHEASSGKENVTIKENDSQSVSKVEQQEPEIDISDSDIQAIKAELEKSEPQIDKTNAVNFHITPDIEETTGKGFSPKEKFRQNVEAIRTLEKIESEHRVATPEEQEILAKYVGWGGLADAFDETKANWASEYQELKNLLSSEEYASARESTLNATVNAYLLFE